MSCIKFCSKDYVVWSLRKCLWREFWILLRLCIIQPPTCFASLSQSSLKLSQTNTWKKPHYLIGQLLDILPCKVSSQHAIFYKARWMLISDPLFKFPLVHELIVCGLFEIFLHEVWLKILCEAIADVNRNYSARCKG